MTVSDHKKIMKQIKHKKAKLQKFLKHNVPKERSTGLAKHRCEICGRPGGHIHKYGLRLCRHCFREISTKIGFKKYS